MCIFKMYNRPSKNTLKNLYYYLLGYRWKTIKILHDRRFIDVELQIFTKLEIYEPVLVMLEAKGYRIKILHFIWETGHFNTETKCITKSGFLKKILI